MLPWRGTAVSSRWPTAENMELGDHLLQMSASVTKTAFLLVKVQKEYIPTKKVKLSL
jgi:hypothetical protein